MEIADGEQHILASSGKFRTDLGPLLNPPVEGGAEERERARGHPAVLFLEQPTGDVGPLPHPRLEGARGFDDVAHAAILPRCRISCLESHTMPAHAIRGLIILASLLAVALPAAPRTQEG